MANFQRAVKVTDETIGRAARIKAVPAAVSIQRGPAGPVHVVLGFNPRSREGSDATAAVVPLLLEKFRLFREVVAQAELQRRSSACFG